MTIDAQLYTLRHVTTTVEGFTDAMARLAQMGYDGVQLSAVGCMNGDAPSLDAVGARRILDEHGLRASATHRPWDRLRDHTDAEIEFHHALGCPYTAIGGVWPAPGETQAEAMARWTREVPPVLDRLSAAGIQLGYHNHHHEFQREPGASDTLYDRLVRDADPRLQLEIDTFWVQWAGCSVERLLERLTGRVPVIHVKDLEVIGHDPGVMAPVGEGNLDWDHILPAALRAGTTAFIVEQDECRRDPFDCLASSLRFLRPRLAALTA